MPRTKRQIKKRKPFKRRMGKGVISRGSANVKGEATAKALATYRPNQRKPYVWPTLDGEVPQRVMMKMKYEESGLSRSPAAYYEGYTWRANSIFDPNNTGTGVQPAMFDAMATLFNVYCVSAVKVKMSITNTCAVPVRFGLSVAEATDTPLGKVSIIKRSAIVSSVAMPTGKEGEHIQLETMIKLRNILGRPAGTDTRQSLMTGNPGDPVYLHLHSCAEDESTNITYRMSYTLIYYVELRDPKITRNED